MSARDYAILWVGATKSIVGGGGGGITSGGGNVLLKTPRHKLDGPEHQTADDTTTLDASTTEHGLLPKLSGSADDFLDGTGAFTTIPAATAPAISALGFVGALIIADTHSTPLVFADVIQDDAQTDLVYADL